ncbi:hypothetical protein ACR0ST_13365 [Aliidiomarina sp. Khilg15.8]
MDTAHQGEPLETAKGKHNYIGWIPCVGGHLDFGLIKPGISGKFTGIGKDPKTSCVNFSPNGQADSHIRNIAIQSWVDWKDTHKNADGRSRVCLVAKVEPSEDLDARKLVGSLIIYPKVYEERGKKHKARLLDTIHALDFAIMSWGMRYATKLERAKLFFSLLARKYVKKHYKKSLILKKYESWEEAQSIFNRLWQSTVNSIPEPSGSRSPEKLVLRSDAEPEQYPNIYRVDFEVEPNGITRVSFNDLKTHRHGAAYITDEDRFVICRQAFYYIKYSLHTHKHHGHQQDAMTTIVQSNKNAGLRLLGQIKRELTGIKRLQRYKMQRHHSAESLGIIAYANSLCVSLRQSNLLNSSVYEREKERLTALKSSFESQLDSLAEKHKLRETLKSDKRFFTSLILAGLSLFVILAGNLIPLKEIAYLPPFLKEAFREHESSVLGLVGAIATMPLLVYAGCSVLNLLKVGGLWFWKLIYRSSFIHIMAVLTFLSPTIIYLFLAFSSPEATSGKLESEDEEPKVEARFERANKNSAT